MNKTVRFRFVFDILVIGYPDNIFIRLPEETEEDIHGPLRLMGYSHFTCAKSAKINLIRTVTCHCFRIRSLQGQRDHDHFASCYYHNIVAKAQLLQHGHPQSVVAFDFNDVNPVPSSVPKNDVTILLPYQGLRSNQITKRLKSCVHTTLSLFQPSSSLFYVTFPVFRAAPQLNERLEEATTVTLS